MIETRGPIPAPAAVVWRLLTDTHTWPKWGPSVRAIDCPVQIIGPGTTGRVQTALGLWLPFRITRHDWEAGRYWHWTVGGIAATGHRVMPTGPDRCDLAFTIPAWAPFYLPVCNAAIRRIARLAASEIG